MSEKPLVLVTGGTGFLGIWVIVLLFREGYKVRTTVRALSRTEEIKSQLREAGIEESKISSLEVVKADLLNDEGWAAAVQDVTYVQHVASPYPSNLPKKEEDLIKPAREGTLRVLRAARDSGSVRRVVLTSSFGAIHYGHPHSRYKSGPFTELDWTNLSAQLLPYPKSKTLAELAAWDFMKKEGGKLELTVITPVGIFGPALGNCEHTSLRGIGTILQGGVPGLPQIHQGIIDVRDCAAMHLLAMTSPKASGERFLCIGEGSIWIKDIAAIMKRNLGAKGQKVPTMVLPNWLFYIVAIFVPMARQVTPDLGKEKNGSNAKAMRLLGWQWEYSNEQAIVASAESLIKFGAVKV